MEVIKNPLEDVKAGLLDSSGQQVPLQEVHVRCKLMDLLSQVGMLLPLSLTVLIVWCVTSRDGLAESNVLRSINPLTFPCLDRHGEIAERRRHLGWPCCLCNCNW